MGPGAMETIPVLRLRPPLVSPTKLPAEFGRIFVGGCATFQEQEEHGQQHDKRLRVYGDCVESIFQDGLDFGVNYKTRIFDTVSRMTPQLSPGKLPVTMDDVYVNVPSEESTTVIALLLENYWQACQVREIQIPMGKVWPRVAAGQDSEEERDGLTTPQQHEPQSPPHTNQYRAWPESMMDTSEQLSPPPSPSSSGSSSPRSDYYYWLPYDEWHNMMMQDRSAYGHHKIEEDERILFCLAENGDRFGAKEAWSRIYWPTYVSCVRRTATYKSMMTQVQMGRDLMIIDVDGPDPRIYPYGMEITPDVLAVMNRDSGYLLGHGYACAWALLLDLAGKDLLDVWTGFKKVQVPKSKRKSKRKATAKGKKPLSKRRSRT
jgi:hypothetical protein